MDPETTFLPLYPSSFHPRPQTRAILYFSDGAIRVGFWNGEEWLTELGPATPENWQSFPAPTGLN